TLAAGRRPGAPLERADRPGGRSVLPRLLLARPARAVVAPALQLLGEVVGREAGRVVVGIDVALAVTEPPAVPASVPQRFRRPQVPALPHVVRRLGIRLVAR